MALEIKAIPTLHGKEAERFVAAAEQAEHNARKRNAMQEKRSRNREEMLAILKKAYML